MSEPTGIPVLIEEKQVGTYIGPIGPDDLMIQIYSDEPMYASGPTLAGVGTFILLRLEVRDLVLTKFVGLGDLENNPGLMAQVETELSARVVKMMISKGISDYKATATVVEDPARFQREVRVLVTWKVLPLTLDQWQRMFDSPVMEPV